VASFYRSLRSSDDDFPVSLLPPGTLLNVAKEMPATIAATAEHDCVVFINH
jgi:hypothetical protein